MRTRLSTIRSISGSTSTEMTRGHRPPITCRSRTPWDFQEAGYARWVLLSFRVHFHVHVHLTMPFTHRKEGSTKLSKAHPQPCAPPSQKEQYCVATQSQFMPIVTGWEIRGRGGRWNGSGSATGCLHALTPPPALPQARQ